MSPLFHAVCRDCLEFEQLDDDADDLAWELAKHEYGESHRGAFGRVA